MEFRCSAPMALEPPEIGKHIGIAPSFKTGLAPDIVVTWIAADRNPCINRSTAPERPPSRHRDLASVEGTLWFAFQAQIVVATGNDLWKSHRHILKWMVIRATSFR